MKCRRTIFCDRVSRCGFHKKHGWTCYSELVLLHPVGSAGHVVDSGASGPQNIDALFFMFGWDQYGFDKKRAETRYAELVFFESGGICESCRAFWCIQGKKH
jgi:hypothetical protein